MKVDSIENAVRLTRQILAEIDATHKPDDWDVDLTEDHIWIPNIVRGHLDDIRDPHFPTPTIAGLNEHETAAAQAASDNISQAIFDHLPRYLSRDLWDNDFAEMDEIWQDMTDNAKTDWNYDQDVAEVTRKIGELNPRQETNTMSKTTKKNDDKSKTRKKIAPSESDVSRVEMREALAAGDDGFKIDFDAMPKTDVGTPYVTIGEATYMLPYAKMIPQTMEPAVMASLIQENGITDPVEIDHVAEDVDFLDDDEQVFVVVDGNHRVYFAWLFGLKSIPTTEYKPTLDDRAMDAIARNTQRRQLRGFAARKPLYEAIKSHKGWHKLRTKSNDGRQSFLARVLGVSNGTVSNDLKKLEPEGKEEPELTRLKTTLRRAKTGTTYLQSLTTDDGTAGPLNTWLQDAYSEDEIKDGWEFVESLKRACDDLKKALIEADQELKEEG